MINLTTLSPEYPVEISNEDYDNFVTKKDKGWSNCDSQLEWLAKLYYIRKGYKEKKNEKGCLCCFRARFNSPLVEEVVLKKGLWEKESYQY